MPERSMPALSVASVHVGVIVTLLLVGDLVMIRRRRRQAVAELARWAYRWMSRDRRHV